MKKLLIRMLSVVLAVVLILTAAPLGEFWGVEHHNGILDTSIEAKAATKSEIQAELLRRLYNGAGGRITCDFDGYVSTPGRHEGIDCGIGSGKTVYAIADGVVTAVGGSYGIVAIYNSTYDVTIIYMHTKSIKVSTGMTVTTGQAIALESNTAPTSMGVHTHVELRTGRRTGAAKSTNDATLDNPNPYPYYEKIFSGTVVHSPTGAFDHISAESGKINISGWAFDKDDINAQLDIHVYIGGPAGSSSAEGHSGIKANTSRADVNDVYGCGNNHGYSATIKTSKTGSQTVYVYAINVGGGSNVLIGSKTVNISGASVNLTNNTSYSSLLPIKAYLKGTSKVYPYNRDCSTLTGGEIWPTDQCTINAIYTNGWCEVVYPTSSGNKTAYTQLSNFMGTGLTKKTAGVKSSTYSRADALTSIGSVSAGDVCYVTTTSGSYSQVIYPTSSGNKLGWVLTSALNYTAPSTDARFSPYTPIKGYILSGDTRQNVYESDRATYAGQLFVDDYCTIDAVYADGWCLVTYPAGSTTKQKYAPLGAFVHDTGCTPEKYVSNAQIQVFPKADMKATVTWYISSGDTFFILSRTPAVAGQIAQVLYPIDAQYGGGYKIGWIYQNQIPTYTYTVSYNANGGSGAPASQTKQYNVDLTLSSTIPTKSGYTFSGWSTSSSATSVNYTAGATYSNNSAVTLYAVWTPNKYTVTYNANGGSGAPSPQTKTHGVNLTLSSTKPVKSYQVNFDACGGYVDTESKYVNYTFIGWSTSSSATSATYSAGANFASNANTTLYAVWSTPQVGALPFCSRDGYVFKGWYTAKTGGTKVEASTVLTGSSTTLYAQWTAETYAISYDANGGSGAPSNQTKTHDQTITLSTTKPIRTGYTFIGWSTDSDATNATYVAGGSFAVNANTTLYAVWKANAYTVAFNGNGSTSGSMSNLTMTYGTAKNLTANAFVKTGYTFNGWNTKADGSGTSFADKVSVNNLTSTNGATVTLYAQWKANTGTKYVVNHYQMNVSGSGYTLKESENKSGTSASSVTIANLKKTYTGFTYEGGKGVTAATATKPSTLDTTTTILADGTRVINIYYSRNKYALTLSKGTGISAVSGAGTYYYGQSITINATVSTGYTWSKWSNNTTTKNATITMPANALTLTANATVNTYAIAFNGNGSTSGSMSNLTMTYGTAKNLTANAFAKTGYTFNGWNTKADGSGTSFADKVSVNNLTSTNGATVTLYAQWKCNHSYTSKVTTAATCEKAGVKTYTCSRCSHSYTEAIAAVGHKWTAATCTAKKTCSVCKTTSGEPLGHSYSSKVTTAATCEKTGVKTFTCSRCSHSYTESIAATGHSFGSWTTTTAAKCTTIGKQTRTCSKCSKTETKDIAALGHNYSTSYTVDKAATCTTTGSKSQHCSRCTSTQNVTAIPATGHNYVNGSCTSCGKINVTTSATITVTSVSATAGSQVKVAVSLKNNPGITSMLLKVNFDTTKLQLVSVEDSGNLGSAYHSNALNSPFTLSWANDTATTNYTYNGDIVVFTFKIKDGAALGSTPITVTYDYDNYDIIDKDMNPVEFNVVNGSVNVIDVIIGDVNNDGKVNQLDRVVLTRYLANWTEYPEGSINTVAADVNCDGKVNTLDRVILTRYIANWTGYESLPYNN